MGAQESYPPVTFAGFQGGQLLEPSAEALTEDCKSFLSREVWACIEDTMHTSKPTKAEVASISQSIERCDFEAWTLEDLAKALSVGCTALPAYCGGTRKLDMWQAQQLWFIDIDNDPAAAAKGYAPLEYTEAIRRCAIWGLPLVMSYETFSSAPSPTDPAGQRYRLVFAREEVETDRAKAVGFGEALLSAFPECDSTTAQPNRLFYGTDKEVIVWQKPF